MPRILVVDDSVVDRRRVGGLLAEDPELIVDFATDGFEALQYIERMPPDLVLTDLVMPGMDGLELVATIASQYPLVPTILMTGRGSEQIAVQSLQSGAASYVPKREMSSLLLETIHHVLEVAHQQQSEARLMDCLVRSDNTFLLRAEPCTIPPLINHLHEIMRQMGVCDESEGIRVSVALEEAINNALFHGNLEIDSQLRTENIQRYRELVEHRCSCEPFCDRLVNVRATITRQRARFVIRDEGPGFNPDSLPDPTHPDNLERACGRGLLLMRTFMDSVEFNDAGNEVTMIKYAKGADMSQLDVSEKLRL